MREVQERFQHSLFTLQDFKRPTSGVSLQPQHNYRLDASSLSARHVGEVCYCTTVYMHLSIIGYFILRNLSAMFRICAVH